MVRGQEWCFSVSSCYDFYTSFQIPFHPRNKYDDMLDKVWILEVPFKIKTFGWRLFINRLPTEDLLKIRGIAFPLNSLKCALCGIDFEDKDHFFFQLQSNEDYLERYSFMD